MFGSSALGPGLALFLPPQPFILSPFLHLFFWVGVGRRRSGVGAFLLNFVSFFPGVGYLGSA